LATALLFALLWLAMFHHTSSRHQLESHTIIAWNHRVSSSASCT